MHVHMCQIWGHLLQPGDKENWIHTLKTTSHATDVSLNKYSYHIKHIGHTALILYEYIDPYICALVWQNTAKCKHLLHIILPHRHNKQIWPPNFVFIPHVKNIWDVYACMCHILHHCHQPSDQMYCTQTTLMTIPTMTPQTGNCLDWVGLWAKSAKKNGKTKEHLWAQSHAVSLIKSDHIQFFKHKRADHAFNN